MIQETKIKGSKTGQNAKKNQKENSPYVQVQKPLKLTLAKEFMTYGLGKNGDLQCVWMVSEYMCMH